MKKLLSSLISIFFATLVFSSSLCWAIEVDFETDPRLPIVYINAAIKAGSITDPSGQWGLTNFMGEMLLRGTRSRTKEQIDLALDQMGAKLNVETRAESLIIRGAVLSSQLTPYLRLISEILTQPSFPEKEIRKLKSEINSIIQEELGHDSSLASRKYNSFLFQNHPYGKPIIGKARDIEKLTRNQIIAHYHRLVRDSLLLIIGTGDASSEQVSQWALDLAKNCPHSPLSSEDEKILAAATAPAENPKRRLLLVDKPERTQTQIYGGQIGVRLTDKEFFPLYLGNYAFGGPSFSSTLMVEIRVKKGWSYGANSSFRHGLQPRSWTFHLFPAEKDAGPALETSLKLVNHLKESGLTPEQFNFSKLSLVNSAGFMYNTPKKRMENKLLEKTLSLPDGFFQSFGSELQKLQLNEVNQALKNFVKPDHLSITVLGTAKNLKDSLLKATGMKEDELEVVPYTAD